MSFLEFSPIHYKEIGVFGLEDESLLVDFWSCIFPYRPPPFSTPFPKDPNSRNTLRHSHPCRRRAPPRAMSPPTDSPAAPVYFFFNANGPRPTGKCHPPMIRKTSACSPRSSSALCYGCSRLISRLEPPQLLGNLASFCGPSATRGGGIHSLPLFPGQTLSSTSIAVNYYSSPIHFPLHVCLFLNCF